MRLHSPKNTESTVWLRRERRVELPLVAVLLISRALGSPRTGWYVPSK